MSDAPVKMSKVIVDGTPYEMPAGANLLGELLKLGRHDNKYPDQRDHGDHYVPHYCWHPGLSVSGNCRMCFVNITTEMKQGDQVKKVTTPSIACNTTVRDGMEIDTRSEGVKKIQNGVQEFLLINHPLDCPECDKSGECRLQDYAFDFGRDHSRFDVVKAGSHIKQLGPSIDFFGTRCIQCSRCIRFTDEVSGTSELCFVNRGDRTTIDTFPGEPIDNGLDLNVVQVCPVGALKNHDFLYQARVWSLQEGESVCNLCAKGCAVRYDSMRGVVKRVYAAENRDVNGWWACNEGRLDFGWINSADRLLQPRNKQGELSWDEAYSAVVARLKTHMDKDPGSLAVVLNCSQTVEELYLMRKLFKDVLHAAAFAAIARPNQAWPEKYKNFNQSDDRNPNRRGVELVFGIADAEGSVRDLASKLKGGKVKTLVVVNDSKDGFMPKELEDALGKAECVIGLSIFDDAFAKRCDVALAVQTHVEKDGSYINMDWRLQAFRKATPDIGGEADTRVLQELIERIDQSAAQAPALSAAAVFNAATKDIPQLNGYTHRSLRDSGGVKLM